MYDDVLKANTLSLYDLGEVFMKRYKIIITLALLMSVFSLFAAGKKETTAELVSGNLKLKFYERSGSFCLYRLSEVGNETWEPLYDDRALASTNYYSLLI